jgi:hypothetical protein
MKSFMIMHLPTRLPLLAAPLLLVACSQQSEQPKPPSVELANAPESAGLAQIADGAPALINAGVIEVVKTPACGCCEAWVDHVRAAGFEVRVQDIDDVTPTARQLGVPDDLRSCHTASIGGYAIEGHVPADDIKRLLREQPKAAGIAVAGMPIGSPGMEQGDMREAYTTMLFDAGGNRRAFAQH